MLLAYEFAASYIILLSELLTRQGARDGVVALCV